MQCNILIIPTDLSKTRESQNFPAVDGPVSPVRELNTNWVYIFMLHGLWLLCFAGLSLVIKAAILGLDSLVDSTVGQL